MFKNKQNAEGNVCIYAHAESTIGIRLLRFTMAGLGL